MLVLWENERQTVNQIGERLFLASNTLTPLIKRLEQNNLLERNQSKEDQRTVIVSLTKKGNDLKLQAKDIPGHIVEYFADNQISIEEFEQFQITLNKLVHVLDDKVNHD